MLRWIAACILLVLSSMGALAQSGRETIHLFKSEIDVLPNGGVLVTESLTIEVLGREIKRGILRDIPVRYRDRYGNRVQADLEVISVERDGRSEPYALEWSGDLRRVRIGRGDHFLEHGIHRYVLTYRMSRMVGFFEDYDEIYWNATGDAWSFPIERAEARVRLPRGAAVIQQDAYTGPPGAQGKDFTFNAEGDRLVYRTTRRLNPGEGLTVAVAFPKGMVAEPSDAEKLGYLLSDNAPLVAALAGLGVVLAYFVVVWSAVGRDPAGGAIIARYHPPEGLSPAAARFVWRMGFDNRVFSAALVSAAVKGRLAIEDAGGNFVVHSENKVVASLSSGERRMVNRLLSRRDHIELKQKNHKKVRKARKALKTFLTGEYETAFFLTNRGWFLGGLGLIALTLLAVALVSGVFPIVAFMSVWLTIWTFGCYALVRQVVASLRAGLAGSSTSLASGAVLGVFSLPFLGGEVMGIGMLAQNVGYLATAVLVVEGLVAAGFYHWLHAPTRAGRRLMDEIEGFRQYLEVAEQPRLEAFHPPEETPDLFEKYLPYALALEVENAWCARFAGQVGLAGAGERKGRRLGWYRGAGFDGTDLSNLGRSLGGALTGAAGTAATAPGSSSGSGGGGSSGGGGGGGGGSGW
jgi:hypothetical protein